ncbi:fumarylacetoacetate hydrolase family protein [Conexibacter sp. CPCC 206217]|uniref:fumarylacetoacetate hydrolase family protein n=1 Tax=Conexibacter sp. CPCC 206217 TaxID=3064574 RepID=UPI00271B77A4|nr:fumarylacetoacetate hydrolase family protein [Conexibacter sp. CPCC 206217]MDO8208782.1 fumarylacetoacetate hydrolase family protein [Conexibacter sp. CPCC 206217]
MASSERTTALFRVELPDGAGALARGRADTGPAELLDPALTLADLLAAGGGALARALAGPGHGPLPSAALLRAPVDVQEVWACGVTYLRSRDARMEESEAQADAYSRVYAADRPELFFKATAARVRGDGEPIATRADSSWDVPEPELTLVLDARGEIAGYTIGNDVSSRSIEGENPLYLPQAKCFEGACAIGPGIVPTDAAGGPFAIRLTITRDGAAVYDEATSTAEMKRTFAELARYATRALAFPAGVLLMTGTSLVPDPPFTLLPGDEVAISVPGLGRLRNTVGEPVGRRDEERSLA